jgi:PAS domain S-box-containing protein
VTTTEARPSIVAVRDAVRPSRASRPHVVVDVCAAFSAITGGTVLLGWLLRAPRLTQLGADWPSMKPNTAIGLLASGTALALLHHAKANTKYRRLAVWLALAVTLLGVATLLEYAAGWDLGIDELLFEDRAASPHPGRMSVPSATWFTLIGGSMVLWRARGRLGAVSQLLVMVVGLLFVPVIAGYVYGVPYDVELLGHMAVPLPTAVTSIVLAVGVLFAHPERGVVALARSPGPGGIATRLLLPIAVVAPLALGWLTLAGERAGFYGSEFGLTLMVGITVGLIVVAVMLTAARLDAADARRVAAEAALEQTRVRADAVLRSAQDAIVAMNHHGTILDVNAAAERAFGYRRDELIGRTVAETIVPPDLRDQHMRGLSRYLDTSEPTVLGRVVELRARRADGSEFPAEVSIVRVDAPGPPVFTGFIRDISERARAEAEIRALNETLEQRVVERTADLHAAVKELDAFAYSVSHDLRAPLRAMDGFSQILIEEQADALTETGRQQLSRVREGAQRMGQLIDDLLKFSRLARTPLERTDVDPTAIAGMAAEEVRQARQTKAEIVIDPMPPSKGDPALLRQVYMNLIDNACKFSEGRPDARIEVGAQTGEDGDPIYLVRDNGVGFDMAHASKLFGVFQRLHGRDEFPGTGVGLATVERIVHRHGGRIWAEAAPDAGATFFFTLEGGADVDDG